MARYNEILVGRFARGVQKLFGMKGEVPVASLAGELSVTHGFLSGAENRYLEGWDRFAMNLTIGAQGAGNNAAGRIRNPTGSNVVAVLEAISCWNSTAIDAPFLEISKTALDLSGQAQTLIGVDPRGRPNSSMVLSSGTRVVLTQTLLQKVCLVSTITEFIITEMQELPLLPGMVFQVGSNNANQGFTVNFMWRERFLEESERT